MMREIGVNYISADEVPRVEDLARKFERMDFMLGDGRGAGCGGGDADSSTLTFAMECSPTYAPAHLRGDALGVVMVAICDGSTTTLIDACA